MAENKDPAEETKDADEEHNGDEAKQEEEEEEEEEDYMSMSFAEESSNKPESSIQRRARQKKEAELKARPKSKEELAAEEARAREEGLATSIDKSNKGFKLMEKLGFKGGALGKQGSDARTEPIALDIKEDKGGIGLNSERKRKIREQAESETKRVKADEGEFRDRWLQEKNKEHHEHMLLGAMMLAQRLDEQVNQEAVPEDERQPGHSTRSLRPPLLQVNVLWRGMVKRNREHEQEHRRRVAFHDSLSSRKTYEPLGGDIDDTPAMSREVEELEEEDPELDEFNAQEPETRLLQLVQHLRSVHNYCYYCRHQYPDDNMDGCPGPTEEDHD